MDAKDRVHSDLSAQLVAVREDYRHLLVVNRRLESLLERALVVLPTGSELARDIRAAILPTRSAS